MTRCVVFHFCFFFNDTATTEIYTLSLHDALPIYLQVALDPPGPGTSVYEPDVAIDPDNPDRIAVAAQYGVKGSRGARDRKSTRLNSSHSQISYAVFCLKKKKNKDSKCICGVQL